MLCHFYRLCVQRVGITTIPCAPTGNDLRTTMNVIVIDEDHDPVHSLPSSTHQLRSQSFRKLTETATWRTARLGY